MNTICDHHDGHGLNEKLAIGRDAERYRYTVCRDDGSTRGPNGDPLASIAFQSQNPAEGVNGVTDESIVAVLLDRAREWQKGPLRTRENALYITKLEEALHWKKHRADDRARRGVLGSRDK